MAWNVSLVFSESANLHGDPYTRSVTIPNGPKALVLMLGSSDWRDYYFDAATFDGVALTKVTGSPVRQDPTNGYATMDMYYIDLTSKPAGTYNLYYSVPSAPDFGGYACYLITGNDSGTRLVNTQSAGTASSGTPTRSLTTTKPNTLIVDCFYSQANANFTPGTGQTQLHQINPESSGNRFGGSYKVVSAVGATTMSWTGTSDRYASIALALNPKSGGAGFLLHMV